MVQALTPDLDAAVGVFRSPEPERSNVVELDEEGLVRRVLPKPAAPPSDLIWRCAAARRVALTGIESAGEPGFHFDELARAGRLGGVFLSDVWADIGTHEALRRAQEAS